MPAQGPPMTRGVLVGRILPVSLLIIRSVGHGIELQQVVGSIRSLQWKPRWKPFATGSMAARPRLSMAYFEPPGC